MEWLKIAQVAEDLKVSKAAVYKRVESLKEKLTPYLRQENGKTLISQEGFALLQQSIRQKKGTLWEPKPNQVKVESTFNQQSNESLQLKETFNQVVEELKTDVRQKNQTIDRLLGQLEEDRKRQAEERQRTDTIIMKLAHDLEATRKSALAIEAKVDALVKKPEKDLIEDFLKQPSPKIEAWTPPAKVEDPLSGMNWFQKAYVQIVEPWRMRRYVS
jgi:hypothetical protein